MEALPVSESNITSAAYATFHLRVRAILIDMIIESMALVALLLVGELAENVPGSGRAFVIGFVALIVLYEPLQVWLRGATIGHRRANIRIVNDVDGGHPSFVIALARFILKSFLGLPSFIMMAFTRRHQALHDVLTRTTVQLRDRTRADVEDYHIERDEPAGLPPWWQRVVVIVLYFFVFNVVSGWFMRGVIHHECIAYRNCTSADEMLFRALGVLFLFAVVAIIGLGWAGRLWGARRRPLPNVDVAV